MIKKLVLITMLISIYSFASGMTFNLYTGWQTGRWNVRDATEKGKFDNKIFSTNLEVEQPIYSHISFLVGGGYEHGFKSKDNDFSYDIVPLYIGGKFYYFQHATINPYIVGRIGNPFFQNIKEINLNSDHFNGWGEIGAGVLIQDSLFFETTYKQHITNYSDEGKDYNAKFFSLKVGIKLFSI